MDSMLQDDHILRQIREMVRAALKMLFQVDVPDLTQEILEDEDRKETLESLLALMEEGKIDEAENRLYDLTSGEEDEDRHNLEAGLLFYYILNCKDDDFLEEHDFSREEIMTGIQDLADRYGLSGIAEAFRA